MRDPNSCDRSAPANRPPRLTPEGRKFYRRAIEILRQCEAARTDFVGGPEACTRLRIGILDTLPQEAIVEMFRQLGERGSDVQVDLWEGSADRVAGWLAQERVAIAWTQVADLSLNTLVLWREPLVAVVAPTHPFATTSGRISVRDLGKQPFVHRSRCELDALGRAQLKAAHVSLDVTARIEREDLAFELVRRGAGITLAPTSLVPDDLIAVAMPDLTVMRSIGLQWQAGLGADGRQARNTAGSGLAC
ncbi:MAG: LysR family transcriptional regulator substrate-binding protein [Thiobacillus sp.]